MKSTRKHELQTNELADFLGRAIQQAKPHARVLLYGAVGVAAVIVLLVTMPSIRGVAGAGAAAFNAAMNMGDAQSLRDFLKARPDAPQAPVARLLLAERLIGEVVRGQGMEGPDAKAKAAARLAEARELYGQVAAASENLRPLAQVGLALLAAQEGDVEKGKAALQKVVADAPGTIAAEKAKVHLEMLADYKPAVFSDEPLEEPKKPDAKPGEAKPADGKDAAPKPDSKGPQAPEAPQAKPAETPKAPDAKPAETPKPAPGAGDAKPDAGPKG